MKALFRRARDDEEEEVRKVAEPPLGPRSRPQREQRLMHEANVHWGRGLWIIVGMAGTVIVFLVILALLPKPGTGNPLDSLTALTNPSSATPTPVAADVSPAATTLATAPPPASPGPSATGTPGPKWLAIAPAGRSPNVRSAASTNNNPIGALAPGRQVQVLGRSADGAWLQIVWDNNVKAWVAADLMSFVNGDQATLPVVQ